MSDVYYAAFSSFNAVPKNKRLYVTAGDGGTNSADDAATASSDTPPPAPTLLAPLALTSKTTARNLIQTLKSAGVTKANSIRVVKRYSGTGSVDKFVSPSTRVLSLIRSLEKEAGSERMNEQQTESGSEGSVRLVIEDDGGVLVAVLARVVSAEDTTVLVPKDDRDVALEAREAAVEAAAAASSLSPRAARRVVAESEVEAAAAAAAAAAEETSAAPPIRIRVHYKSVLSPHFVAIEVRAGATAADVLAKALPALASSKRKEAEVDLTVVHRLCNASSSMQTHRLNAHETAVGAGAPSGGEFFVVPLGRTPPAGASLRDQRHYAVAAGYLVPTATMATGANTLRRFTGTGSADMLSLENEARRRATRLLSGADAIPRASLRTRSGCEESSSPPRDRSRAPSLSASASTARADLLIPADPGDSAARQRRLSAGAPQLAASLGDTTSVTLRLGRRFQVDEEIATLIEEDDVLPVPPPTPPTSPPPPDAPPPDLTPPPSSLRGRPSIQSPSAVSPTLKAHLTAASSLTEAALADASDARLLIVSEWIDTESLYVGTLELVVRAYIRPLSDPKGSQPLAKSDINTIFSTWESLTGCNKILLDELSKLGGPSWSVDSCVGPVVLVLTPYMKLYTMYAQQYERSRATLRDALSAKKSFRDFCSKASKQHTMMDPPSLADCLRLPLSRMADYMDFLRRLIKVTPLRHPDRSLCRDALRLIVGFAKHADDSLTPGSGGTGGVGVGVGVGVGGVGGGKGGRSPSGLRSHSAAERPTPMGGLTSSLTDMSSTFLGLAEREAEGRKTDLERTAEVVRTLGSGWEDLYAPHRRFIDRLSRCQVEHVSDNGAVRRWLPATLYLFNDLLLVQVGTAEGDRSNGRRGGSFISLVRRTKSVTLSTDGDDDDSESSSSGSSSSAHLANPVVQLPLHLLWLKNIDVVDKLVELLTPDSARCLVLSFPSNSDRSRWVVALAELISDSLLGRAKHAQRLRVDPATDVYVHQQHAASKFLTPPPNPSAPSVPPPLDDDTPPTCPRCSARTCTTTVLPLPDGDEGETRARVCTPCALDYWYRLDSPSPTTPVDPRLIRNEDGIRESSLNNQSTSRPKTVASNSLGGSPSPSSSRLRRGSMVIRRLSSSGTTRPVRIGLRSEELRIVDTVIDDSQ
jgi:hypothetical protein